MQSRTRQVISTLVQAPSRAVIALIRIYQKFSPAFGPRCRYHPSCSEYSAQALHRFGLWKGLALTLWRVLRCQPLCSGGFDPVPEKKPTTNKRLM